MTLIGYRVIEFIHKKSRGAAMGTFIIRYRDTVRIVGKDAIARHR